MKKINWKKWIRRYVVSFAILYLFFRFLCSADVSEALEFSAWGSAIVSVYLWIMGGKGTYEDPGVTYSDAYLKASQYNTDLGTGAVIAALERANKTKDGNGPETD